ncbi:MAG: hypothetical protein ACOCNH_07995, partial [Bacteroidales bacterium]
RATCFMRGNAPCGVKGVMGYALSARGIFAPAQKCRMYQSRSTFPQGVALGYGQHLGLQPAPIIYRAFVQICSFSTDVFLTFSAALGIARTSSALHSLARKLAAARHNPSKLGFCARLAQTLSFLIKPRGILSSKMTKPRGKTLVFLTKPRGMNDFVKPNEQSSSLLEYSAMARNRTFKKDTLYAFFYPEKTFSPS